MKRIYPLLILVVAIVTGSCKKFLDTKPTDFLQQETYYQNESQLITALAGVYDVLGNYNQYTYAMSIPGLLTMASDDVYFRLVPNASQAVANNSHDYANPYIAGFWEWCYKGIERANVLIANIDNAQNVPEAAKNAVLGETKFLRAYYHFLLVQNFGDIPLKITPTTDPNNVNIPRTPASEVYAQILKDMTEAEELVYPGYSQFGNSSSRVTKTVVQGMLTRVCLFMAGYPLHDESKYSEALAWADKVIASNMHSMNTNYEANPINIRGGAGDSLMYNLTNNNPGYVNNPYSQIFLYESRAQYYVQENMWEVDFNAKTGVSESGGIGGLVFGPECQTNYSVLGRSANQVATHQKLYVSYGPGDFRRDWICGTYTYNTAAAPARTFPSAGTVASGSLMGRQCNKWRREYEPYGSGATDKTGWFTSIKYPLLRYTDVVLMRAEAENRLNGPSQSVYDAVNQVRRRAYGIVNNTAPIKTITLTSQGSGYTSAPVITISGGGVASAAAVISGGKVTGITIRNAGIGYSTPPTITFSGGGGTGASATVTLFTAADVDLAAGLGKDAMQDSIAMERYREFPGESLRKSDLIRWGTYLSAMQSLSNYYNSTGIPASNAAFSRANIMINNTLAGGTKFLLFPIPSSEILVNKAMTQNPGW